MLAKASGPWSMGCLSIYSRANETITMVSAPFLYPAKVYEILYIVI